MDVFAIISKQGPEPGLAQADRLFEYRVVHGTRLPGEELITCRTSAIAASRARASSRLALGKLKLQIGYEPLVTI